MIKQFQAISDPTRFAILELLKERELPAGKIAEEFPHISRPAVSQHIRILKNSNLLWERREGTKRIYRLRKKGFYDIYRFMEEFWDIKKEADKKSTQDNKAA
ncbi:MAG: transcriptional regulator [Micavibrio sp.]|nr:MAG: transcriptional regulator [Micavibrio sp.]